MRAAVRRPLLAVAAIGLLALGGGLAALRLEPRTGADTLVGRGSDTYQATHDAP